MCSNGTCARFNSKLVRIRSVRGAMNCATTSQEDKGFNSKLVRLEGGPLPPRGVRIIKFQFQTGSIRREYGCWLADDMGLFQFQTGSIRSLSLMSIQSYHMPFQFQTGSIRRETEEWQKRLKHVSIPNWFD